MDCKATENSKNCNCTYPCNNKGVCCECIAYHRNKNQLPACYFTADYEKTYDRSINNYLKSKGLK